MTLIEVLQAFRLCNLEFELADQILLVYFLLCLLEIIAVILYKGMLVM